MPLLGLFYLVHVDYDVARQVSLKLITVLPRAHACCLPLTRPDRDTCGVVVDLASKHAGYIMIHVGVETVSLMFSRARDSACKGFMSWFTPSPSLLWPGR